MLDWEQGIGWQVQCCLGRHGEERFARIVRFELDEPTKILAPLKGRILHDVETVFIATIGFPAFEMRKDPVSPTILRHELDHVILNRAPAATFAFHREDGPPIDADDLGILKLLPHLHLVEGFMRHDSRVGGTGLGRRAKCESTDARTPNAAAWSSRVKECEERFSI